ncbi:MAG TPA: hypothetical protein ENK32_03585 [Anaerolineae bacterium]|nr:hypothetical protein [Anaerolineae bacterium]
MDEQNPVVLLSGGKWHIVTDSRRSETALCGQRIQDRRAHTRLSNVGLAHVCRQCAQLWHAWQKG